MFWKFNLVNTSHIESLLSKETVTLQELMDEDDLLQECKAQNKSLIDFLTRPEIMEEMVNLIITEPPEDLDEKIKYKYPNIACEVLISDVQQINDALGRDESLLCKLYSFLETEKPLNPLLASFFSKTMAIFILRKTEVILEFLKSKEDFIVLALSHLSTSAVMDVLLRLVSCVEMGNLRTQMLNWLNEQRLIQRLIALIDTSNDKARHANASQLLADIIRYSREQMMVFQEKADHDPLLQTLEATETVTDLINHMFNGEKNETTLVSGISVLLALLEFKKQGNSNTQSASNEQSSMYFLPEQHGQMTALDAERMAVGVTHTLDALKPHLKEFHKLLLNPPHKNPIPTTIGLLDQPLGNTRIHVTRLLSSIVSPNRHNINIDLADLGTMDVLLDLFFKFTWNNFLHTQVEQCIGTILANAPSDSEDSKDEHPLLTQLFSQCCLIQRILDAWEDNDQQQAKPGGNRRGYMGHLTRIANHVAKNSEEGPSCNLIKAQLKEIPDDYLHKWEAFVSGTLAEVNKKNQIGSHPLQTLPDDDDPEFRDIPFPQDTALQQAFSDYQMQQMTSNFIDQFGFTDDEFGDQEESLSAPLDRSSSSNFDISAEENTRNSDLFERACSERIQPFDDADSDEDIWEEKVQDISFAKFSLHMTAVCTPPPVQPVRSNSNENSTDSEEEAESPTSPVVRPIATNEEMKMDVDQSEAWTANFDSIPMEVVPVAEPINPWGNPNPANEKSGLDVGWANFSDFASFSNTTSTNIASSPPIAMETSEGSESRYKYVVDNASTSLSSTEMATPNRSNIESDHLTTSSDTPPTTTVSTKEESDTCPIAKPEELTDNFNFLSSTGLLKSSPSRSSDVATTQENGPVISAEPSDELAKKQALIEETRAKAKEALDKLTAATNPASNGPV